MKQIFKYFILVNLLCGFNSCDILEENPKDFVSPQNFLIQRMKLLLLFMEFMSACIILMLGIQKEFC